MNQRFTRKSVFVGVLLVVLLSCLIVSGLVFSNVFLEMMAKSMTPELYPNAMFVLDDWDGGSSYQSKGRIYVVHASIQQVRVWMNERSPGFVESEVSSDHVEQFVSYKRCNQGILARALTRLELGPADFGELYPCASVWLSADISSTTQTTMTVWVGYPSR